MPTEQELAALAAAESEKAAAAQAAVAAPPPQAPSGDPDLANMDEKTRNYILSLRKEAGKYRTEAKSAKEQLRTVAQAIGGDGETIPPEQLAAQLAHENQQIAFRSAVLEQAMEHGVGKDGMKFFQYLLAEARDQLAEGEELSQEAIAESAKQVKASLVKPMANTTVAAPVQVPIQAGGNSDLTPESFAALSFNEKCRLYETNEKLYSSLYKAASAKRLIK